MPKKIVLAIGIDPAFVDFSAFPNYTPELLRNYIDGQIERLRELGYGAESCLIDLGETAEAVVAKALRSKQFDCVVIGAGLRQPPEHLVLFETVLNLVHALVPNGCLLQHHAGRHRRGRAALDRAVRTNLSAGS